MNAKTLVSAYQQGIELFLEAKFALEVIYSPLEVVRLRYRLHPKSNWVRSLDGVDDGRAMVLD